MDDEKKVEGLRDHAVRTHKEALDVVKDLIAKGREEFFGSLPAGLRGESENEASAWEFLEVFAGACSAEPANPMLGMSVVFARAALEAPEGPVRDYLAFIAQTCNAMANAMRDAMATGLAAIEVMNTDPDDLPDAPPSDIAARAAFGGSFDTEMN